MNTNANLEWRKISLGEIAIFRNGINYTKDNFGYGVRVINVRDFGDKSFPDYDSLDEINPERVVRQNDLLENGDILFVRSNGNRQLIGRSIFIDNIQDRITHSAFTIRVRFDLYQVEPRFYAYLFRSSLIRHVLSAYGGGTNISNLNQQILTNLVVPLPPLPTQRKIADILSAYDDLIENNTRRIRILEQMAQAVYREWFVHFRFPGHEGVKVVEGLPEGWGIQPLENALILQRGFDLPIQNRHEGNVPIYAATGITGTHNEAKIKGPGVVTYIPLLPYMAVEKSI